VSAGTLLSKSEEWGHPSSQHSCASRAPHDTLAPITPPVGGSLPELFAGQRMHGGVERDYKESGVQCEPKGSARKTTLPNRNEPLEIILLY
jgi:hypothetical protein